MFEYAVKQLAGELLKRRGPDQRLRHAAIVEDPAAHGRRLSVGSVVVWPRHHHGALVHLAALPHLAKVLLLAVEGCWSGHGRRPSSGVAAGQVRSGRGCRKVID